jgi:hypothetical protein
VSDGIRILTSVVVLLACWGFSWLEERRRKMLMQAFETQRDYVLTLRRSWDEQLLINARHALFLLRAIPRWHLSAEHIESMQRLEETAQKIEARLGPAHPDIPGLTTKPDRPRACA